MRTPRLTLIPATIPLLEADIAGPAQLEQELQKAYPTLTIPEGWPTDEYDANAAQWVLDALKNTGADGWYSYYFILNEGDEGRPLLVGVGGYKGPPDVEGEVEFGYSIVAPYQRRGLATEASLGLIQNAWTDPRVSAVAAETLVGHVASISVMEKCGLRYEGPTEEEGVIRYRLDRPPGNPL